MKTKELKDFAKAPDFVRCDDFVNITLTDTENRAIRDILIYIIEHPSIIDIHPHLQCDMIIYLKKLLNKFGISYEKYKQFMEKHNDK